MFVRNMQQRLSFVAPDSGGTITPRKLNNKDEKLSEESDYDEKRKIRLALRHLRQRERDRESGEQPVNGRNLTRSQSFVERRQRNFGHDSKEDSTSKPKIGHSSNIPENQISEQNGEVIVNGYGDTSHASKQESSTLKSQRRYSDFSVNSLGRSNRRASDVTKNETYHSVLNKDKPHHLSSPTISRDAGSPVVKSPKKEEDKNQTFHSSLSISHLRSNREWTNVSDPLPTSESSSELLTSSSKTSSSKSHESSQSVKDTHNHRKNSTDVCQKSTSTDSSECNSKYQRRFSFSAITPKEGVKEIQTKKEESNIDALGKSWIEKKKRSSSLPGNQILNSLDMEAAFSELLSAVDQRQNSVDTSKDLDLLPEDSNADSNGPLSEDQSKETMSSSLDNDNENEKRLVPTPQKVMERSHLFLDVTTTPDKNSAISVIEDDDGAVTVSSTSHSNVGDTVITEKTRLRRSESNTEEEERDTIIETKLTSPGGTYHYEKDITKSKRKITQRGSDYYSRSKYVVRKKHDNLGGEIEEHNICLETDNFSVTKGEAWGDTAEAKVQLANSSENLSKQNSKENTVSGDKTLGVSGRMNVSKTSSGYGSVSGSDEEEREETVIVYGHQGRPSGCPEIRATLKEVVALEGTTAVLECTVICSPLPTVTWYKDSKVLNSSPRYNMKFDGTTGKATLTIKSTTTDDRGEYKCNFQNPLGEAESATKVTVKKKATRKPEFKKRLKEQSVTEGQSVELECVVNEASHVSWYKDGIIQRNSADFKQTFDGVTAKLEISEIFLDDKGEYACVAKNDLGETKTVCKINVKETASDANVAPIFLTKPGSKILNGGDTLLLQCDVIGTPKPEILWTKDGSEIPPGRGYKESYDGRLATFKISDSNKDDSGKYECTAKNIEGKVSVDALIVVKAKQGPPEILHQLSDISVVMGKSVTLQCDVRSSPAPMIVWRKDGRVIGNMPDFYQTYDSNVARLTIKEVCEQDCGCYDCIARNSFGSVTSTCKLTVTEESIKGKMSPKLGAKSKTPMKTDWIVGRDKGQTSTPSPTPQKDVGVKRSESVRVTSDNGARARFLQRMEMAKSSGKEELNQVRSGLGKGSKSSSDSNDNPFKSLNSKDDEVKKTVSPFKDLEKSKDKVKVNNDPPWKNVSLRRTESARAPTRPVWSREKAEDKAKQEVTSDKTVSSGAIDDKTKLVNEDKSESTIKTFRTQMETPPPRPVITLRRTESARTSQSQSQKKDFLGRAIDLAMEKSKQQEINNNRYQVIEETSPSSSSSSVSSHNVDTIEDKNSSKSDSSNTTEEKSGTKLSRTQSARLVFENRCKSPETKPETPLASFLARRDNGVRRTSSLKVTPAEKEAGWFRNKAQQNGVSLKLSPLTKGDKSEANMPSYENMDDEEELHKILSKTEDFEERKKIRTRMRELRDIKAKEIEERRIQREKENEDIIRRKHEMADQQKARTLAEFDKMAKTASEERNKILQKTDDLLKDKIRRADEDKARTLAAFDKIAQKEAQTKTSTVVKTEEVPGGTRTTVIKKTETTSGFGGVGYGKPTAEQAAKFLTEQLKNASCIGTEGKISVKTESWNSRDGGTFTSQKTESWGAKTGAGGAMAAFKKMDSATAPAGGTRPNGLLAVSYAKKAATTMRRNAVAIKQEILSFVKKNTESYEGVEVTNFSSSWNNGLAFCALIHNFYPDSFDFSKLEPKNRRHNFTLAFDTAEKVADIAPLLDVEDMVRMKNPDWKCVFTYVQSFYRKLHNHEANKAKSEQ